MLLSCSQFDLLWQNSWWRPKTIVHCYARSASQLHLTNFSCVILVKNEFEKYSSDLSKKAIIHSRLITIFRTSEKFRSVHASYVISLRDENLNASYEIKIAKPSVLIRLFYRCGQALPQCTTASKSDQYARTDNITTFRSDVLRTVASIVLP